MTTTTPVRDIERSALFDDTRRYRYRLARSWGHTSRPILFVMLNPSTADAAADDATIRRLYGFTRAAGNCAFEVVNLFALRSTDPRALVVATDPVGPGNDDHIRDAARDASQIVVAWGASYPKLLTARTVHVLDMLTQIGPVHSLGTTKAGDPRHPVRLPADTPLTPFARRAPALASAR